MIISLNDMIWCVWEYDYEYECGPFNWKLPKEKDNSPVRKRMTHTKLVMWSRIIYAYAMNGFEYFQLGCLVLAWTTWEIRILYIISQTLFIKLFNSMQFHAQFTFISSLFSPLAFSKLFQWNGKLIRDAEYKQINVLLYFVFEFVTFRLQRFLPLKS